jgi:squalene-hopene/tetraprenyl-beta-curcumene cyclase
MRSLYRRCPIVLVVCLGIVVGSVQRSSAAEVDTKKLDATIAKGVEFLKTKGQAENGSFTEQSGPAITALVATALLRNGVKTTDETVAKALKFVEGFVQEDGGIYKGDNHRNYHTCLAVMCLVEANKDGKGKYDETIKNAEKFLRGIQWDESEGAEASDVRYGGQGYGSKKRPDLSNTQFYLDALKALDVGKDDPSVQAALKFVSQCQNLESAHNTGTFAAKNPDGGFVYTAANGGESQAGAAPNGGLRSYGSMTYAGLKSMIYAGVAKDDARVKAATTWIKKNYDLKQNPGMGPSGLYYYYNTFAKALDALGQDEIEDADGKKHNWREELVDALAQQQKADGSWINENSRWLEGDPNLVTGYALLALSHCRPDAKK